MKNLKAVAVLLFTSFLLVQCNQTQDNDRRHMTDEGQTSQMMQDSEQRRAMMSQMMQDSEQRRAMMAQMAENPEMRNEFMSHMNSAMMRDGHDQTLDRMETMMNDPGQREQMRAYMQRMMEMMESETFDREQMREMIERSPMVGMHMNCMQMMSNM